MDYCGIEFTALQSADTSSWKWQLSTTSNDVLKSCGEAASQRAAINEAHEAIGASLRAHTSPDHTSSTPRLIGGVLHILHGARGQPPSEAVEVQA
jgi:hypothetical protein